MNVARQQRRVRASLFLSAAGFALAAAPALATDGDTPPAALIDRSGVEIAPQTAPSIGLNPADAERVPQIVIGHPGTPGTALDPSGVNGVGQMIIDNQDGTIGLCTGTLINPRTVIFAAHCVNSRAASAYGANSGGTAIGWGFASNNNAAGASAFGGWLYGTADTDPYETNRDRFMYNANAVAYHPLSLENGNEFLYGDLALASLDTPAEDIPTWALLFSPLPQTAGGPNGTGYHVNITGYGRNGTGSTGSIGSDYRRRAAENMLGALASIDDFESFLFGGASGLPQNLYWLDFDDPRRGTGAADPRDFNAWRDNPQPNEGITASGDSGGPLILDRQYARQVVIGVLSGGYTRFFNGAPANGYGTASFYQPLYLYWDWIAANNPYRYVTNVAGNRNWNDAANWVTTVDPNYQIIGPDGQLVTGVPSTTGEANTGTGGKFGEACFEGPVAGNISQCYNFATGAFTAEVRPIGTGGAGEAANSADTASAGNLAGGAGSAQRIDAVEPEPQAPAQPLPAPTIANGLPGATGFVPNNSDGDRANGVLPRYFDVTLSAAGTTTLSSAVTVDRFTLHGVQAGLNITSGGSLTSLMNISQIIGTMHVDGTLSAPSDFFILAGGLSGNGQINAPFTTSVAGVIAPGTATSVGTLTFNGNLILASGTSYIVDIAGGTSDLIAVKQVDGEQGVANIGGALSLQFTNTLRGNTSYTILTAEGGVTGGFDLPSSISAILRPTLSYTPTSVRLNIVAGNYRDVVSPSNTIAYTYAQILDSNRARAANYDSLYGPLDLQDASTINATLSGLAPASESTVQTLAFAAVDSNANFIRNRLQTLDPANLGGTLAHYGQPVQVASLGLSPMGARPVASDMAAPMLLQEGALPDNMSGFISGGYLNGDGRAMTGIGGRDNFDGWYVGGGIEVAAGDNGVVGFALSYSDLDGTASLAGQTVQNQAIQGTLYGKTSTAGGVTVDGHVTAGALNAKSRRVVNFLGTSYTLRASDSALVLSTELGIGKDFGGDALEITPRIAARGTHIGFGSAVESGGPVALDLQRQAFTSYQGRAGITVGAKSSKVRPFVTATYVHEFSDQPGAVFANLVGAPGGFPFALNGEDKDWGEISGGLTLKAGSVDLSIAADTTIERSDLSVQTYRGSVTFRF